MYLNKGSYFLWTLQKLFGVVTGDTILTCAVLGGKNGPSYQIILYQKNKINKKK